MSINYIPRVTQLDSVQLDGELEELFKQLLFHATKFLEVHTMFNTENPSEHLRVCLDSPGILQPLLPEIELLIRTCIFKYSVYSQQCTFGQQMLSLKYKTDNFSKSKLYWYFGYTIGLKYLRERALYSLTTNTNIQNFLTKLETIQVVADVFNFLRFIQIGKYPILIDFILGLELSADKLTREDLTDFSWTRELLWHNFIELIGTAISLINIFGLKRRLSNILKYMWWRKHQRSLATLAPATMTLNTTCACCDSKPILPHVMGCSHIFCYYCLMANKSADQDFGCPKCYYNGKQITKFVKT